MPDESRAIAGALQDLPIQQMLRDLALGIAEAQQALDQASIAAIQKAANEKFDLTDKDGNKVALSVLEAGLIPSFYQFREATIDLSFSLSMHVEQSVGASVGVTLDHTDESTSG